MINPQAVHEPDRTGILRELLGVPIIAGRDFRLTDNRMVKRANPTDDS